jgi:predicted transcriptional regulator
VRRSKLETYEVILEALVKKPLNIDRIAYKTSIDCTILSKHLDFLVKNGLVEERMLGKKLLYAMTERGMTVFRTLDFQKYLKKISNTLMQIDEAMQTIRDISKDDKEKENSDEKY